MNRGLQRKKSATREGQRGVSIALEKRMLGDWIWRSPERFLPEREGVRIVHHRHKHVHRKLSRQRFIEESGWNIYGARITQLQSLGPKMLHTHCRRRCDKGLSSSRVDFQHRLSYCVCTATGYDHVHQCVCVRLKSYTGSHTIVRTADHWDRISFPSSFICVLFSVRLLKGLSSKLAPV